MRRIVVLAALVTVGGISMAAARQAPQGLAIRTVKDNLYMITGQGGNVAVFVTANGVVLVDAKNPGNGQGILEQIKTVTDKPVTTIIATHTHGDHVGSIPDFPAAVNVVAHENTKTNMATMKAFQGEAAQFLPDRTFKDRTTLLDGRDRLDLYYFGAGHTSGDALIVFPALRAMHSGDLFAGKGTPIIDTRNGGSGLAYPKTLAAAASAIKDVDVVIAGHTPEPLDWSAFREYGEFMQEVVAAVQAAAKAGKSEDEAASSLALPEKFKGYNMGRLRANITAIYAEVKAGAAPAR
jgi:glyoxylase-like metal-dependent hydrolase (beta-lactamase superfamily II)